MNHELDHLQKAGINAFRAGDYETAAQTFEALLQVAEQEGNEAKMAEALNDLGVIYKQLGDIDGAIGAIDTAIEKFQAIDNLKGEAQAWGNLAATQEAAEQYDEAVANYMEAAAIFQEIGENDLAMYSWQALSRLRLRQKEWVAAIAAYEKGIAQLPDNSIKKKVLQQVLKMPEKIVGTG